MLELMNMAALEANAERRVEVLTETMKASRRRSPMGLAAVQRFAPEEAAPRAGMECGTPGCVGANQTLA